MSTSHEVLDEGYDYVVVGGGLAGCVVAARLSEDPRVRVALLEAGAENRYEASAHTSGAFTLWTGQTDWGISTVPQPGLGGRVLAQPAGRLLGGSAAVNIGYWSRGTPADYDAWEAAGATGWGWANARDAYERVEGSSRPAEGSRGQSGPMLLEQVSAGSPMTDVLRAACLSAGLGETVDHNGAQPAGFDRWEAIFPGGRRRTSADAYLTTAARARPNLHVTTGATVTRVVFAGTRAVGVEVATADGTSVVRAASEVVLCAGTLRSPQLLLLSGVGPADDLRAHGVDVVADAPGVGTGLFDHLCVAIGGLATGGGIPPVLADPGDPAQLHTWRRTGRGPLSVSPFTCMALARSGPGEPEPDVELLFATNPPPGLSDDPGASGYTVYAAHLQPRSRGAVTLASADPHAAPVVDPRYLSDPDDLPAFVTAVRTALAVAATDELSAYSDGRGLTAGAPDEAVVAWIQEQAFSLYHPCGTLRMGPADAGAPVDPALRVRGVTGLRVVDASVMPSPIRGHTMAPVMYVAERGSELVQQGA